MTYGTVQANAIQGSINTFSPNSAVLRNRIINGAMVIDQRNAGASVNGNGVYTLDRWQAVNSVGTTKYTVQQNAGSVTPPAGFTNYLGVTSTSAYTVGATEYFYINQNIEGYNWADLNWGSANAKTVTLSFWVRSSLTGTFGGSFVNWAGNRSYPFSYTISSANTWEQKSITVAGDTTGTWAGATNAGALQLYFSLGTGSTYSGTAGAWAGSYYGSTTGATSVVGTNGATFYITGVQLEVGSTATSFDYRPYTTELQLCQRYYFRLIQANTESVGNACAYNSSTAFGVVSFPVTMRTAPDIDQSSGTSHFLVTGNNSGGSSFNSFSYNERSANCMTLYNVQNVSIVQGYGYWFRCNSSASGQRLAFTAEL